MELSKRILFTSDAQYAVAQGENKRATLVGYAMVWGALSSDRGGYKVRLLPGSATFENPTFALYHHSFRDILARSDDNSLRVTSDDIGVKVEIDLPDTTLGRDIEWLVANRRIRGMSFAMIPVETFDTEENGESVLNVKAMNVDEVTVTAIPAFEETSVEVKRADSVDEQLSDRSKELAEQYAKLDKYELDLYGLTLAEFQRKP